MTFSEEERGLWAWIRARLDPALYRPRAEPGVIVSKLRGRDGNYYVLKNPDTRTYYRLGDPDYFLWQRMDGTRTVKDLVVAYYAEYGSLAFGRVNTLVAELRSGLFLVDRPVNIYQIVRDQLAQRDPTGRVRRLWDLFSHGQLALPEPDRRLETIYKKVGWLFYTRPAYLVYLVITFVGLVCFAQLVARGGQTVLALGGSQLLGIVGLMAAYLLMTFFHEAAHALTVKHFGREMARGGFMLYYGTPAFYADVSDMAMENKRARLAVTWAGLYSELILAALASITIYLWPGFALNGVLYQLAVVAYLTVFVSLNPLLELDGYLLLTDWLDYPALRTRSLTFLRSTLPGKVNSLRGASKRPRAVLAQFSREERIFTLFGMLSAVWSIYAVYWGTSYWGGWLSDAGQVLWRQGGLFGKLVTGAVGGILALIVLLGLGLAARDLTRWALRQANRLGLFATTRRLAGWLLALAILLGTLPLLAGYPAALALIGLAALALAAHLAGGSARDYAGASLATAFWLLATMALALLFGESLLLMVNWGLAPEQLARPTGALLVTLGYVAAGASGLAFLHGMDLRQLPRTEAALLFAGTLLSAAAAVQNAIAVRGQAMPLWLALPEVAGVLFPLLAVVCLVPLAVSYWQTGFGPASLGLILSMLGLAAASVWPQVPAAWAYLLLVGGLALQQRAYRGASHQRPVAEPALRVSDYERLHSALTLTASSLYMQARELGGQRRATALARQFNGYARAAGWHLRLHQGQLHDDEPAELDLRRLGDLYGTALSLLLDLMAAQVGEKLTTRALQRSYDALPWYEREIAAQYLFADIKRAEALGQEFRRTQQVYRGLVQRLPLFATMSSEEIDLLCSRLQVQHYRPGQTIIRQGERGDRFYILNRGHVEVIQTTPTGEVRVVDQLHRGRYFGELALLNDAPRNATCRVTQPTEVLTLTRDAFDALVRARFDMRDKLGSAIARAQLLRAMPLFSEMDAEQIQLIAAHLREEDFAPGAIIIQQGELGQRFYVVESGRVEAVVATGESERVLSERGPGEYVGEIALLLQMPRTATVRALTQSRVLVLERKDFEELVAKHLYASKSLEREVSRRMIHLRQVTQVN